MLWFFRYFTGYLYIVIKGEFNENVLNLCAKNRITLWNSRLHKKDIETCISIKDFKRLRIIIRGHKVRLHIIKKVGLPFKIQKNRNRSGLLVGFLVFALFLKIMSDYIWVIDVSGNKKVTDKEILGACRQIGITEGIRAKDINPKTDREHLLLKCDSLSWASLNIEGCRLTVNVTEIGKLPEKEEGTTNLKANADGIIKKIDVTLGNCVVKVGDTVKKGDLLVSGISETADGTKFTRSLGEIYAETTREYKLSKAYKQSITSPTGETKQKRVLEFFALRIPLYLGKETQNYNSKLKQKNLTLFSQTLPIRMYTRKFCFVNQYTLTYKQDELKQQLQKELEKKIKEDKIKNYKTLKTDYAETEDGISLTALISAEENIAISEELLTSKNQAES